MHVLRTFNPRETLLLLRGLERALPPTPTGRVKVVHPRTATGPAPAFIFAFATGWFDENAKFGRFFVDRVVVYALHMGIDDCDELRSEQGQFVFNSEDG
jgi:hypothetical protein